jgi:hypothetical protein
MRYSALLSIVSTPAIGTVLALPMPAFGQEVGAASDFSLGGEVAIATSNVDDDLSTYNEGLVLQPSLTVTHESGFYLEVEGNIALDHNDKFNEVDFNIGYENEVSDDLTLGLSAGYWNYTGGAQVTVAAGLDYHGASLEGEYYIPTNGEAEGFRLKASYTKGWERFSLAASVTHDTGAYDDVPAVTVGALKAEYNIRENLTFSVVGQIPIAKQADDERSTQITATLTWRF